ncbi:hypothetical protein BIY21_18585 [Vibrio ponticus]|uniref:Uncharacterized protein n=1 Tax=Vibrio ponticus TaxID=265668 RepID=A0ABX3F6Q0_9VIBR|nr:hypothetical protein BIY21_18585 [Vibrio ponticus]
MLLALHVDFKIELKLSKIGKKIHFKWGFGTNRTELPSMLTPHLQKDLGLIENQPERPNYLRYW